jgi:signal transduction histidine kinase
MPVLLVDRDRLRQVLNNLLGNALRHAAAGGAIWVTVEGKPPDLQIRVRDDGSGITPEHLDRVFDRFYRSDTARSRDDGGAGLGLAVVRAIVEAHGGGVTAASPGPGQGSTFTISLPL